MGKYHAHIYIQNHFQFRKFFSNAFNELLIADTFRLLAISMVSIFIPIFLLDQLKIGIWQVVLVELFVFVLSIFLHFFLIPLSGSIGAKKIMIVSYTMNIILFIVLYFSHDIISSLGTFLFLFLIIILNASSVSSFWSAHHLYFLLCTRNENKGQKLGIIQSIPLVVSIAGPFIGSVLIVAYSFKAVFLFSIFLFVLASINLLFSKDIKIKISIDFKKVIDAKNFKKNSVLFIQGLSYTSTGFIWPILLFVSSINLVSMGIFFLFSNISNAVIVYIAGKNSDIKDQNINIKIGAIGHGFSIIFRALSASPVLMGLFQSMGGLFGGLWHVLVDSDFYKQSYSEPGNKIMNRELYMHLGRICTVLIFACSYFVFNLYLALIITMIITGFITTLLSLLPKKNTSLMKF
jgi:MFS family permease